MQVFIFYIIALWITMDWIHPEGFLGFLFGALVAIPLTYVLVLLAGVALAFIAKIYLTVCRYRYNKNNPE